MAEEEIDEGGEVDGGGGDQNFKITDGWWWCSAIEMVEEIEVVVAVAVAEIDEGSDVDGGGGDRKLLRWRRPRWWWWWRSKRNGECGGVYKSDMLDSNLQPVLFICSWFSKIEQS
ncbi:hypothetical protein F0562_006970 [Nyssa sinensis]|uniref:Uncharacterized protein n=1 Tax=Nyssa sinensis TaxID=561372 RepID=A0A5J5A564_9ASTE|nr:hypothetical protein F0562_006970 [Nyssa sinensis]